MAHPHLTLVRHEEVQGETALDFFNALFRRYASYVGAIGIRLLGRPDEVDDLVQEVFLDAYRSMHKLQGGDATKRWLSVVTVRHAYRRLRTRKLKSWVGFDGDSDYAGIAASGADPSEHAMLADVYVALDQLPIRQRLVWALRHLQGEELTEIAHLCGCSLATVKRELAAAHGCIQEAIGDG